MIDKERTAKEPTEYLVGMLILSVNCDMAQHRASGDIGAYPKEWSDDTKQWWEEIESRMKEPTCLNFDEKNALQEIDSEVDKQKKIMGDTPKYDTSWRKGRFDGLWMAQRIIKDNIHISDNIEDKKCNN